MRIEENGVAAKKWHALSVAVRFMILGSEKCFCGVFSLVRCALPQGWGRFGSPSNREAYNGGIGAIWGYGMLWGQTGRLKLESASLFRQWKISRSRTVSWELDSSSLYAAVYGIQLHTNLLLQGLYRDRLFFADAEADSSSGFGCTCYWVSAIITCHQPTFQLQTLHLTVGSSKELGHTEDSGTWQRQLGDLDCILLLNELCRLSNEFGTNQKRVQSVQYINKNNKILKETIKNSWVGDESSSLTHECIISSSQMLSSC